MSKIRVGMDVGQDGGIAVFKNEKLDLLQVTPNIGTQIDLRGISNILETYYNEPHTDFHVVVEDVHAIGGSAAGATFAFGWSLGILEGILGWIIYSIHEGHSKGMARAVMARCEAYYQAT